MDSFNNDVELTFETDDLDLSFTGNDIKMFPRILLADSIYDFYPQIEISYNDSDGSVLDRYAYVEGMKFTVNIGSIERGYVGHDYMWGKNILQDIKISDQLSGVNFFAMPSNYFRYNHRASKGYSGLCSSVARTICSDVYKIADPTIELNIENTLGMDWRYQCNETTARLLENICTEAVSAGQSSLKSPYITFFNTNGNFYFCSMDYLMNQVAINVEDPYKLIYSEKYSSDPMSILDYDIEFTGVDDSFHHYKKKYGRLTSAGTITEQTEKIEDHMTKKPGDKYLVRKQDVDESTNYEWLGIQDKFVDVKNFDGKLNYTYRNALSAYRIRLLIQFNSDAVAGKTIELEFGSFDDMKGNKLKMLSGNWLIAKSNHHVDPDYVITSELELIRPCLPINNTHPFYSDFL